MDALVVGPVAGAERVFTLASADRPYRNFVESMSDGAATVSEQGIVLYANQALADLVGSSCERIVGRPVLDLVTPLSRSRLAEMIGPASPGGSVEATLLSQPCRDGAGAHGIVVVDDRRRRRHLPDRHRPHRASDGPKAAWSTRRTTTR